MRVKCIENKPYTTVNDYGQYDPKGKHKFVMDPVPWFTAGKEYDAEIVNDNHFWAASGSLVICQDNSVSDLGDDDVWLTIAEAPGLYRLQGHKGVYFQIVQEAECAS